MAYFLPCLPSIQLQHQHYIIAAPTGLFGAVLGRFVFASNSLNDGETSC
ncbi:hypothetical protein [Hymenobacter sediminis]|nr:hypothetical protein [Hymenobacter sediminis]